MHMLKMILFLSVTCFLHDFGQHECSERGHLAGLAHHRAACSQRWGHLEGEQVEGQVPWRYQSSHTHWTAARVVGGLNFVQYCGPSEQDSTMEGNIII